MSRERASRLLKKLLYKWTHEVCCNDSKLNNSSVCQKLLTKLLDYFVRPWLTIHLPPPTNRNIKSPFNCEMMIQLSWLWTIILQVTAFTDATSRLPRSAVRELQPIAPPNTHMYHHISGTCAILQICQMRSSVFWDVTKRRLIVTDVSGQTIGPIFTVKQTVFLQLLALEDKPDEFPKNSVSTRLNCITSQKSKGLIDTAAEAWNNASCQLLISQKVGVWWMKQEAGPFVEWQT